MQRKMKFFNDIEKLRGLACLLVLLQHIYWICPYKFVVNTIPDWLFCGSGGVAIFFAISGFVITLSLLDKIESLNGNFLEKIVLAKDWLVSFYKKRFFRIFPVVFFVIIITGIYLFYCEDYNNIWVSLFKIPSEIFFGTFNNAVDMFMSSDKIYEKGMGPFWTLAVESLFYIIWPVVLIICSNNSQRAIFSLTMAFLFMFVINPGCHYHLGYNYYWTTDNLAELIFGAFFAFLYREGFSVKYSLFGSKVALIFSIIMVWVYPSVMSNMRVFYYDVVTSCSAVFAVMLCVFCEGCLNFSFLNKFLTYLGSRSFSFYACQLTLANIVVWFTNSIYFPKQYFSDFSQFLIFIILLPLVTELMYRLIEKPSRTIVVN